MAYIFGDSFDFYTAIGDLNGYWDAVTGTPSILAGRFSGSRSLALSNAVTCIKSSGSNDATHHLAFSLLTTVASTSTVCWWITLGDGATAQCTIVGRSDGVILLTSGDRNGSTLATWANPGPLSGLWTGLEFEVTIHNTAGAFHARKNGSTSNDFDATSLNTRGGTANNYANRITVGESTASRDDRIDDLLWFNTSGAAPNTWVGDVRGYQLMPTSDASKQFAPAPNPVVLTPFSGTTTTAAKTTGNGFMMPFTANFTGTIAAATVSISVGGTGNLKAAIYDANRGTVLATSNAVVNPVAGNNAITFGTPLSVTKGTLYHLAVDTDFSITYTVSSAGNSGYTFTTAYASFPAASPATALGANAQVCTLNIAPTVNAELVNEAQEDGAVSYVYDATVGHANLYNVADLPANTLSIVAMTTRAYMEKSDAGARTGRVQLKSGGTTVTGDLVLSSSFSWCSRTDTVNPNTSAAWTLANANLAQAGIVVAGLIDARLNLEHDRQDGQRHAIWLKPYSDGDQHPCWRARQGSKTSGQALLRDHRHDLGQCRDLRRRHQCCAVSCDLADGDPEQLLRCQKRQHLGQRRGRRWHPEHRRIGQRQHRRYRGRSRCPARLRASVSFRQLERQRDRQSSNRGRRRRFVRCRLGAGIDVYPVALFNTTSDAATGNFGGTAFSGTVPSGYTSGWDDTVAALSMVVPTQIGVEAWASTSPQVQVTQIGEEAFIVPNPAYQLTQAGNEVWLAGTPQMQLTQAGLEMWATVATGTVQMVLTQVGLEVWRSVANAAAPGHGGSMITVIL